MLGKEDRAYYTRRAAEELERGDQAAGTTGAAAHFELAYRYAVLAAQPAAGTPKLTPVNEVFPEDYKALEQTDRPTNNDLQVEEAIGERNDRPIFDGWREETQVGSAR